MMISRSEQLYLSGDQDVDLKVDTSNYGPNLVNLSDNTLDNIFEITDTKKTSGSFAEMVQSGGAKFKAEYPDYFTED